MKNIIRLAYEGYLISCDDENFIVVTDDIFEGENKEKLLNELANFFDKKGYTIYMQGELYVNKNKKLTRVNAEQAFIAIKENKFYK